MSEKMGQNRSNSEFCPICKKVAAPGRRKMSEKMGHEPDDGTNFGSHAFPTLIRISVKQNSLPSIRLRAILMR